MDFLATLGATRGMLTEGAIAERLRRRDDIELHPMLFNTPLIYDDHGRACMTEIYGQYRDLAARRNLPILLCAPTWRVDRARMRAAGFAQELNKDAVAFMRGLQAGWHSPETPLFVGGLVGPKNDCYSPTEALDAEEAEAYHAWQVEELAAAGVDVVVAQTFPAVSEALGVARACRAVGIPFIISFYINRAGLILDATPLHDGVREVDDRTGGSAAGFMVNCVYPSFLQAGSQPTSLFSRLVGIQANASSKDHNQLENSATLQQDSLTEWGELMLELNRTYGVKILGGCCGTDNTYIDYLARGLARGGSQ